MLKKSWYLFLVLIIEGAALMAVELMGAKLVAPFYGSSLYVWTAVLAITVFGLSLGYYFGGRFSGNLHSEKPLVFILGISALLVFALPHTASGLISLTSGLDLITGICVTCLLLLLPPMFCFGVVGPLVVRLMTVSTDRLGNVAGTVYFTSTLGGILATFLMGYYLIPEAGLKFCALVTAVALASLVIVYIAGILFAEKQENVLQTSALKNDLIKNNINKKEKKAAIQGIKQIKASIYLFAVLEGGAVMAVELITARMIAPYFGSSLYAWSAVIGFTLLGLALGYYFGGWLADKYSAYNALLWVLLIASLFLMLMHFTSATLTNLFAGMNMHIAIIIVSMLLVVPPLLFLGMVPTLLIRHITAGVDDSGSVTGNVFTVSSVSGIIALFVFGFYVIPQSGLTVPSIIIGVIVGSVPFIKLVSQKKYIAFAFLFCLLASLSIKKGEQSIENVTIQYYTEGLLGQIMVEDVYDERVLFVNRMGETFINKNTGVVTSDYAIYASSVTSKLPEKSNVLLIGLGGGAIANSLHDNLKFNVDVVELDERIVEASKEYFLLNNEVNVIVDDGRHYIETDDKKYDLIFFDAFHGDTPPAHLYTLECFKRVKSLLNKNGLIVVNFFGYLHGDTGKASRSVYKTLCAAGLETKILPTPGKEEERNILLVASAKSQQFNKIRSPLQLYKKELNMDSLFIDIKNIDLKDAVIFTDDKPLLDRLSMYESSIYRQSYNASYTKMFLKNGIPLFR